MYSDMISFCYDLGHGICEFALAEPVRYLTGVVILLAVGVLVRRICNI